MIKVLTILLFSCVPAQPLFRSGNPDYDKVNNKIVIKNSDSVTININYYRMRYPVDTVYIDTTRLYYDNQSN